LRLPVDRHASNSGWQHLIPASQAGLIMLCAHHDAVMCVWTLSARVLVCCLPRPPLMVFRGGPKQVRKNEMLSESQLEL